MVLGESCPRNVGRRVQNVVTEGRDKYKTTACSMKCVHGAKWLYLPNEDIDIMPKAPVSAALD
jgi:hypothetical protein